MRSKILRKCSSSNLINVVFLKNTQRICRQWVQPGSHNPTRYVRARVVCLDFGRRIIDEYRHRWNVRRQIIPVIDTFIICDEILPIHQRQVATLKTILRKTASRIHTTQFIFPSIRNLKLNTYSLKAKERLLKRKYTFSWSILAAGFVSFTILQCKYAVRKILAEPLYSINYL